MRRPRIVPPYRHGRSLLHRAPAGAKLLGVAVVAVPVVAVRTTGPAGAWALLLGTSVLATAVLLHAALRTPPGVLLGVLRRLSLPVLVLAGYQWLVRGPSVGAEVAADLLGLVLLAAVVTVTTPSDRMLDTIARLAAPLRLVPRLRQPLSPERVALTFTLTLRSIDVLWDSAAEARDAARARGRGRDVRAMVTPTVVRAVAHGRATGDALAARGLVD